MLLGLLPLPPPLPLLLLLPPLPLLLLLSTYLREGVQNVVVVAGDLEHSSIRK